MGHCRRLRQKMPTNHRYEIWALYFMAGFLLGYCALYTGSSWTLCRGINTGLVIAVFLLICSKNTRINKIIVALTLLALVTNFQFYRLLSDGRAAVAQHGEEIIAEKEKLSDIVKLSEQADPWENTVAHYGSVNFTYLALPTGFGGNYMIEGRVNEKAKYALITQGDAKEEACKQMLIDSGHSVIYEDDWFIVLIRQS